MGLFEWFSNNKVIRGAHPFDVLAAWVTCRSKLFSKGWGDEALLADLEEYARFRFPPSVIHVAWLRSDRRRQGVRRDGTFASPLDLLPSETRTVHIRAWSRPENDAACVILGASRDEGYAAREQVFGALAGRGLDIYLPENPFYGRRRTAPSASLATFSDHVLMSLGMVWEGRALLDYLRKAYKKVAVAGYSMGGHMAAVTAAVCPFPVACAALATGASAAPIYTQGLLSWSVDLSALAGESHLESAARQRLTALIEAADVTRHAPPIRPDAAVLVGCTRDGYVRSEQIRRLHEHWPGSTLRWLPTGHFSALLTHRPALRDAIADAVARL